jgi:hypothetical protein
MSPKSNDGCGWGCIADACIVGAICWFWAIIPSELWTIWEKLCGIIFIVFHCGHLYKVHFECRL